MEPTDRALIEALQSGDREAAEALLERYESRIYRFGLRLCGDEEAAREVLQETLLAAFRHLPAFRGEAALSTWLFQIARSFCIKERRGQHSTESLDEPGASTLPDPTAGPDLRAQAHQVGTALAAAIASLSPEHREVIVLRDIEGLSAEAAAAAIGIEQGALKSRLHRAREALRARLSPHLSGD